MVSASSDGVQHDSIWKIWMFRAHLSKKLFSLNKKHFIDKSTLIFKDASGDSPIDGQNTL
jgi:hypothetical protein